MRIAVEIDPLKEPRADPWNCYFASRFAWATEVAQLSRGINELRQVGGAKRLDSPLYVEVDDLPSKTTILMGGLPFHRSMSSLSEVADVRLSKTPNNINRENVSRRIAVQHNVEGRSLGEVVADVEVALEPIREGLRISRLLDPHWGAV